MRRTVLGVILAIGGLSIGISAFQKAPKAPKAPVLATAPKNIEVEKVRDNLYVLKGGGGNTAVFIRTNDVVVVDTKYPGWGRPIIEKVKTLTSKPITMIINTHTHRDHSSGNVEFPTPIEIVAHENTKPHMEKLSDPDFVGMVTKPGASQPTPTHNIFEANGWRGLPTKSFKDKMTLSSGADRIDLYYFGPGHTDGDAWVVFPALRAMHSGDIFAGKQFTNTDNNGGNSVEIVGSLDKAVAGIKDVDTIIPGHSAEMLTFNDLKDFANFERDFVAYVRDAKKAGKSVDDVVKSWKVPAKYTGYNTSGDRVQRTAEAIFGDLK